MIMTEDWVEALVEKLRERFWKFGTFSEL